MTVVALPGGRILCGECLAIYNFGRRCPGCNPPVVPGRQGSDVQIREAIPRRRERAAQVSRSGAVIAYMLAAFALAFTVVVMLVAGAPYRGGHAVTPRHTGSAPATTAAPTWVAAP